MKPTTLDAFDASLRSCSLDPAFLDRFYDHFLEASPRVREKFAATDFVRQKAALRASLDLMFKAAQDGEGGPERHLGPIAERHGAAQLAIGAEYYDYWLDSLLKTVQTTDPQWTPAIEAAWEEVMGVGIRYLCSRFHPTV